MNQLNNIEENENKNKPKFLHEFWENEDELWELSMAESFRQRDERLKTLKKYKNIHGEYVERGKN